MILELKKPFAVLGHNPDLLASKPFPAEDWHFLTFLIIIV